MLWQEQHPEFPAHESYASLKLGIFEQIDPNFLRILTPESVNPADMKIRLVEITWGGVVVDGIPALDNPELIAADDADYLRGDDLVFGVEINGDARASGLCHERSFSCATYPASEADGTAAQRQLGSPGIGPPRR